VHQPLYQEWFTPGSLLRKGLFRHPFSLKKAGITQFPVFFGRFAFPVTRLLALARPRLTYITQRAEYFDGAEGSISDGSLSRGLRSLEGKPSAPFLLELCSSTLDP
jgi:hypothetical protein